MSSDKLNKMLIDFTEEFRKSRRNSLLWSGLVCVAALAGASNRTLTVPTTGLTLPSNAVAHMLFIISMYMLLGFVREDRHLRVINSQLYIEKELKNSIDLFDHLALRAKQWQNSFSNAYEKIIKPFILAGQIYENEVKETEKGLNELRGFAKKLEEISNTWTGADDTPYAVDEARRAVDIADDTRIHILQFERKFTKEYQRYKLNTLPISSAIENIPPEYAANTSWTDASKPIEAVS